MGGPGSGPRPGQGKGKKKGRGKSFKVGAFRAGGKSYQSKVKTVKVKLTGNQKSQKKADAKIRKLAKMKRLFPGRG